MNTYYYNQTEQCMILVSLPLTEVSTIPSAPAAIDALPLLSTTRAPIKLRQLFIQDTSNTKTQATVMLYTNIYLPHGRVQSLPNIYCIYNP